MNPVDIAMRRPISILVLVVGIALGAVFAISKMSRDIFPDLKLPVIYVAQPYGGMDPQQMEGFLVNYYEYHFLYIEGIEHVESKSIQGAALMKLIFHPDTNMAAALAETISEVSRSLAFMPKGTVPPHVTRFDAGSVPVGNLVFSSDTLSTAELLDLALFRVRPLFSTLPGVSAPPPFGSSARSIIIHADPEKLRGYNMSPDEVVEGLASTNTLTPSGNATMGDVLAMVPMNTVVTNIKELESVPIRTGSTDTVYLRDIATVEDGSDIRTSYALVNGKRTVYIPVVKRAEASTLTVVNEVKESLPKLRAVVPDDVHIAYEFDQSPYVTNAIDGLIFESLLGAALTGLMVLLFLGDWRSALVVILNIPISLAAAMLALWICDSTVNIMSLGGLALAVGILVDEATVVIENTHTHLAMGKAPALAAYDATVETAVPRLLAMLCILAVFTPSFFMEGAIRALFVPLSLSVGFSMVASYLLSTSFVPIMCTLLVKHVHQPHKESRFSFAKFQQAYSQFVQFSVNWRWVLIPVYLGVAAIVILGLGPRLGTEIFPFVDSGQFLLRIKAPTGTRIERTEEITKNALEAIKKDVGPDNVAISLAFVGVPPPNYPMNLIYLWSGGPDEAILQVQLKKEAKIPLRPLQARLRKDLAALMPNVGFSFEPSDIVSRVMSFGSPTPIEVAVTGPNIKDDRAFAEKLEARLKEVPSIRDLHFGQCVDYPTVKVKLDRERAGIMGVTSSEVAKSVVAATSSSRYVLPNFWADPKSGVAYQVQIEIPQEKMNSIEEVQNIPVATEHGQQILLRNVADVTSSSTVGEVDRYNMQRMVTLNANIFGEDLGHASEKILKVINDAGAPPRGVIVHVRGQVEPMNSMLGGLQNGFLLAVLVIFLLLSFNFQSARLAFIVVSTVPAVASGVVISLWLTGTTLNLESFMGAIMSIGVAVANAILLITFAERARISSGKAAPAAVEGAQTRLRPILMTSMAMIAGMIPMALGLGEGGDQTAPLGRAVIGGLTAATFATLTILPCVFAIIQSRSSVRSVSLNPHDEESIHFAPAAAQLVSHGGE